MLLNYGSADRGTSETSGTCGTSETHMFSLKKSNQLKENQKDLNAVGKFVFGIKKKTLKDKFFLIVLDLQL